MGRATKRSAKRAGKRARKTAEARGTELVTRAADLAERATEASTELASLIRGSDAYARATEQGAELVDAARERWEDSDLEDRAVEVAKQIRDDKRTKKAVKKTQKTTDAGLAAVGGWLAAGPAAEKLGVKPRRKWPLLLAALIGAAVGFAVAKATDRTSTAEIRDELADAADRLAGTGSTTVLVDTIRTTLDADPRTAQLEPLDINVADGGTVFVRGTVPEDVDKEAIRDVVASVPGVTDVDLQLTTRSSTTS